MERNFLIHFTYPLSQFHSDTVSSNHEALNIFKRDLHSLKGLARTYELKSLSLKIHHAETDIANWINRQNQKQDVSQILGPIQKEITEYNYILNEILGGEGQKTEKSILASLAGSIISPIIERIKPLGIKIESVVIKDDIVDITDDKARLLNKIMTHAMNNSIDHGFLSPIEKGFKPEFPKIQLHLYHEDNMFKFEIRDNGLGIDPKDIINIAKKKGIDVSNYISDPLQLLFIDDFSSKEDVSETSGRGVGLSAIRMEVEERGGQVTISNNEDSSGSTLSIQIPLTYQEKSLAS